MDKRKKTVYRSLDVDETGQAVASSPKSLLYLHAVNTHATAIRYLKVYDKATAATNADTPIQTFPLAPAVLGGKPLILDGSLEIDFDNGISIRATTDIADNGVGAPGANEVVVNLVHVDRLFYTL